MDPGTGQAGRGNHRRRVSSQRWEQPDECENWDVGGDRQAAARGLERSSHYSSSRPAVGLRTDSPSCGTNFIEASKQKLNYIAQTGGPLSFRLFYMDGR